MKQARARTTKEMKIVWKMLKKAKMIIVWVRAENLKLKRIWKAMALGKIRQVVQKPLIKEAR